MMDEAGVDRVVFVPPSWPGDRNDYALEAAARYLDRFAVMVRIPLEKPDSAAPVPKLRDQQGMLGVRLTFLGPQAGRVTDGTADWFWPAAEKTGLPVMFFARGQTLEFARVGERHPHLSLIIDHMGLNAEIKKNNATASAIDQVVALASIQMSRANYRRRRGILPSLFLSAI
jgi:predicted TIM-barrel fold metal-dependent hydrolase